MHQDQQPGPFQAGSVAASRRKQPTNDDLCEGSPPLGVLRARVVVERRLRNIPHELELIKTHITQKPMRRVEVGAVRFAQQTITTKGE